MTQSPRGGDMKILGRCNRSTHSGRKRSSIGSMSNSDPGSTEETSFPEEGAAKTLTENISQIRGCDFYLLQGRKIPAL
ncbi:hypothetical protein NC652_003914 [Populus alba x Populus x berolinensis]|nr:hypothetical protein NC652_003914 [Populus alba x Populus x berolinensis]